MLTNENKLGIVTIVDLCLVTIVLSLGVAFDASRRWFVIVALFVVIVMQAASLIIFARKTEKINLRKRSLHKAEAGIENG